MNMFGRITLVLVAATALVFGLTSVFHTEPIKAAWSGWTDTLPGYNHVSEVVTLNVDSLGPPGYCELFSGQGSGSQYEVNVYSYPNGVVSLASGDTVDNRSHVWIRCRLDVTHPESLVRGRRYEFRWSRANGARIQYYYDEACGYNYGHMIAPYPPPSLTTGLAMRAYGRMNAVDSGWWGVNNHYFDPSQGSGGHAALDSAQALGIRLIRDDLGHWSTWYSDNGRADVEAACDQYGMHSFSLSGLLAYGRGDSAASTAPPTESLSLDLYPPRNLDTGRNYWAEYCGSIMGSLDSIKSWEVWPEANGNWYWHDPDIAYYHGSGGPNDPIDTPRERCSLYVRMCQVAESVAVVLGGGRKVIGGGIWRTVDSSPTAGTGLAARCDRHPM